MGNTFTSPLYTTFPSFVLDATSTIDSGVLRTGNVVTGNNFGKASAAPKILPKSMVSTASGNICKLPSPDLACS